MSEPFLEAWHRVAGLRDDEVVELDERHVAYLLAVEMQPNPYGRGLHEQKDDDAA
jgi:hypothetical protein